MGSNGFSEIKSHYFYDDINWDFLATKSIQPPFHLKPEKSENEENRQVISFDEINTIENTRKRIDYFEGFYFESTIENI